MNRPPKIDRKTLKQPDNFVQRGRATLGWMFDQRVRVLPLVVLGVGLLVAIYGLEWWGKRKLDKGWTAFVAASKATEPQKWEELKGVQAKWRGDRPGFFAAVALADHHFAEAKKDTLKSPDAKLGDAGAANANQAIDWYSRALEASDLLAAEKQLLYVNRGGAKEVQGKFDEAMADYKMGIDFGGETKPIAMLSAARIHELKNDSQRAVEIYERIAADFANTEYAKVAKSYLRRLRSPLFQAAAVPQEKS